MSSAVSVDFISSKYSSVIVLVGGKTDDYTSLSDNRLITKAYVDTNAASGGQDSGSFVLTWNGTTPVLTTVSWYMINPYSVSITFPTFIFTGKGDSLEAPNTFPVEILPQGSSTNPDYNTSFSVEVSTTVAGPSYPSVMWVPRASSDPIELFPGDSRSIFTNGVSYTVSKFTTVYTIQEV